MTSASGRSTVMSPEAPMPIGPYSQAVIHSGLLFTSGQIGIDPATGRLEDGITLQAQRILRNLAAVLEAGGSGLDRILKVTVYMARMSDFPVVNAVFEEFFQAPHPARSAVGVKELPLGALVEMEAVAGLEEEPC